MAPVGCRTHKCNQNRGVHCFEACRIAHAAATCQIIKVSKLKLAWLTVRSPFRIQRSHRLHSRSLNLKLCKRGGGRERWCGVGCMHMQTATGAGGGGPVLVGWSLPSQCPPRKMQLYGHKTAAMHCPPAHLWRDGLRHRKQRQRQVGKRVAVRLHWLVLWGRN